MDFWGNWFSWMDFDLHCDINLGVTMTESKSKESLIASHMIYQATSKAQCVVQRVHSTSPQHTSEYGSGLNLPISLLVLTMVLLLVMSFMIRQVHTQVVQASVLLQLGLLYQS